MHVEGIPIAQVYMLELFGTTLAGTHTVNIGLATLCDKSRLIAIRWHTLAPIIIMPKKRVATL